MIYKLNGVEININQERVIGGVTYPVYTLPRLQDKWTELGITEEADPVPTPEPEPTPLTAAELLEQTKQELTSVIEVYLDDAAISKGYDDIVSASSYAATPNAFQLESISFIEWRAAVWVAAIAIMNDVIAGNIPTPTEAELLALLPNYVSVV